MSITLTPTKPAPPTVAASTVRPHTHETIPRITCKRMVEDQGW
jgi:hypothetical protein